MEGSHLEGPNSHGSQRHHHEGREVPASRSTDLKMTVPTPLAHGLRDDEQEREVWCAICLSVLRQPRQLPCRHAFCLHCLEKMVPRGGAVLRCPNCRRSAILPQEGPAALPMDPSLLAVVKKVKERRRIRILEKKCKVCSGCAELQLCVQCPHCTHIYCPNCTAQHAQELKAQVDAVRKRLENFKKQLQSDSLKKNKDAQKVLASGATEDLRRSKGHKRVLSTLKRALSSCKSVTDAEEGRPSTDEATAALQLSYILSLSRQLQFLVKLSHILQYQLLNSDGSSVLATTEGSGSNLLHYSCTKENEEPYSENDDEIHEVKEELLIDLASDDGLSDGNRNIQSSRLAPCTPKTLDIRVSRSTSRMEKYRPGEKQSRFRRRAQRHSSCHSDPDFANSFRSADVTGGTGNAQTRDLFKRSRSCSRCGSISGSSRSLSRPRVDNFGINSGDEDEEEVDSSSRQDPTISQQQQELLTTAKGARTHIDAHPCASLPVSDLKQDLEDQSLLYRCKPSRSLQRLSHKSFLRRPTDVTWCPWNGVVYVTVSQVARVVMFSGVRTWLCSTPPPRSTLHAGDLGHSTAPKHFLECDVDLGSGSPPVPCEGGCWRPRVWGERGDAPGQLLFPSAVACSPIVQELYVLDKRRCRVVVYTLQGNFIREFGSRGHGPSSFSSAEALAVDHTGLLYIADTCNDRILVLDAEGEAVRQIGGSELRMPAGVAVLGDTLLVADTANHKCRVYHRTTGRLLKTMGSRGMSQGQMNSPECVAIDACGFLLVGDTGNNRIQVFRPNGNFVRYLGCRNGKAGELAMITGISVTASLEVLAADFSQHLVFVY